MLFEGALVILIQLWQSEVATATKEKLRTIHSVYLQLTSESDERPLNSFFGSIDRLSRRLLGHWLEVLLDPFQRDRHVSFDFRSFF